MSVSTAIGLVSRSLRNLLVAEMALDPAVEVTVLAPDEPGGNRRVNLFLYRIQESSELRNLDWQPSPGDSSVLIPPPLSLNLFYLLTPYAMNDELGGNSAAHEILGDAMRVFYEHPIVPRERLPAALQDATEQIKLTLHTLDLDELSRVWSTFTQPFRLSVLYEVSVVQLDTSDDSHRPLPARVREVGVPEVRAPFTPPVVDRVEPTSAPAGGLLTFHGSNLSGWRAYVSVLRTVVVDGQEIEGESFTTILPAQLDPGFHSLTVDVSHLFRRTFFVEVTP